MLEIAKEGAGARRIDPIPNPQGCHRRRKSKLCGLLAEMVLDMTGRIVRKS